MTNQEIFDRVVNHLRTQNKQSQILNVENNLVCAYRGPDGLKCSVGCLIDDEHYRPELENVAVSEKIVWRVVEASIGPFDKPDETLKMLVLLQWSHDSLLYREGFQRITRNLREIAKRFNLSSVEVDA